MFYLFAIVFLLTSAFTPNICAAEKPIVIVTPSRNNEEWLELNLTTMLNQKYKNFRVIYIDDCSQDRTKDKAIRLLKKRKIDFRCVSFDDSKYKSHQEATRAFIKMVNAQSHKFTLVSNVNRCGGLCNIYRAVHCCKNNEIIVTLDGDDFFYHDKVLAELNEVYSNKEVWYTHGSLMEYPAGHVTWCEPIKPEVIATHSYRKGKCPSHLRTFYTWLFKKIKLEDLLYEGNFFPMTWDMAMMFPMAEMAAERHAFIKEPNYVYNMATPFNDNKVDPDLQNRLDKIIRNKTPYKRLESAR